MRGRFHDIAALRQQRKRAVWKGMKFMRRYLRRNRYHALYSIGDDAPAIFFEIWYTSADSQIRGYARDVAKEMLTKLERALLRRNELPDNRDGFFALMFLARIRSEMGAEQECEVLLERADQLWEKHGFANTDVLFGVRADELHSVGTGPWLILLMRMLVMEFNALIFPRRYRLKWGMREALVAIRAHVLDGPKGPRFHDSLYLATHVVYALSAYNAIKTHVNQCPWLFRYLGESMRHFMRETWRRDKLAKQLGRPLGEDDEFIYVDIDAVSEIVDTFRGCGFTSASNRMVCEGSLWLLRMQRQDGSWPFWTKEGPGENSPDANSYDLLHPTWVAVQGLRDRDFSLDRPAAYCWKEWIEKLVTQTGFAKLDYTAPGKWAQPPARKKRKQPAKQPAKRR